MALEGRWPIKPSSDTSFGVQYPTFKGRNLVRKCSDGFTLVNPVLHTRFLYPAVGLTSPLIVASDANDSVDDCLRRNREGVCGDAQIDPQLST